MRKKALPDLLTEARDSIKIGMLELRQLRHNVDKQFHDDREDRTLPSGRFI